MTAERGQSNIDARIEKLRDQSRNLPPLTVVEQAPQSQERDLASVMLAVLRDVLAQRRRSAMQIVETDAEVVRKGL